MTDLQNDKYKITKFDPDFPAMNVNYEKTQNYFGVA